MLTNVIYQRDSTWLWHSFDNVFFVLIFFVLFLRDTGCCSHKRSCCCGNFTYLCSLLYMVSLACWHFYILKSGIILSPTFILFTSYSKEGATMYTIIFTTVASNCLFASAAAVGSCCALIILTTCAEMSSFLSIYFMKITVLIAEQSLGLWPDPVDCNQSPKSHRLTNR